MSDLPVTGSDTAVKPSLASQFLASLGSGLTAGKSLGGLFDHMLADVHMATPTPVLAQSASAHRATTAPAPSPTAQNSAPALHAQSAPNKVEPTRISSDESKHNKNAVTGKGHKSQKSKNSADQIASDNSNTAAAVDVSAQTTTLPDQNSPATSNTSLQSPVASAVPAVGVDAPKPTTDNSQQTQQPSLSDLVAQLQDLVKTLREQPAPGIAANSNQPTQTGSTTSSDPSLHDLDQALTELLQVAQAAKNEAANTASASTNGQQNVAQILTQAQQAPTDAQFLASLKSWLDGLKNGAAANKNTPENITPNLTLVADTTKPSPIIQQTSDTSVASPASLANQTTVKGNDLLQQLSSLFAPTNATANPTLPTATATPTPASSVTPLLETQFVASVSGKSGTDFRSDTGTENNANSFANSSNEFTPQTTNTYGVEGVKSTSSYSFASQLANTHTGSAGLPTAVEQVMFQLSRTISAGNNQMTLQLNPVELGRINIKLKFANDGTVQASVIANNASTLDMLQKDSQNLQRALQDAGLQADSGSLQFSLSGQGDKNSNQTADNERGQANNPGAISDPSLSPTTETAETWVMTPGRVNLKV